MSGADGPLMILSGAAVFSHLKKRKPALFRHKKGRNPAIEALALSKAVVNQKPDTVML